MSPEFSPRELRQTRVFEYLLRFVFGGGVSVGAWLLAREYGPVVGGIFLAFPALLPASLTLVKDHDGRAAATDHARGAAVGSLGMGAFALVVWATAELGAVWLTLALALGAWLLVSVAGWWLLLGRSEPASRHDGCRPAAEIRRG